VRRDDHSSRGVLPSVVCPINVIAKPRHERSWPSIVSKRHRKGGGRLKNEEAMTRVGLQRHKKGGGGKPLRQSVNCSGLCVLSNCLLQ
jgi:hypothetical protein